MTSEFIDFAAIDGKKYRTFVMTVPDPNMPEHDRSSFKITIRPSTAAYEEFLKPNHTVMLDAVVMQLNGDIGFAEAIVKASLRGINVDFIEIVRYGRSSRFVDTGMKVLKVIDLHKEDPLTEEQRAKFPRYFVAENRDAAAVLNTLVIDRYRFKPGSKTDFVKGEYESGGIVAGFSRLCDAVDWCEELNLKSRE